MIRRTVNRRLRRAEKSVNSEGQLYLWAFVVRVTSAIVGYLFTQYAGVELLVDALWYEEHGYSLARDWLSGRAVGLGEVPAGAQNAKPLVAMIAVFYYVTGGVRAGPLLLVVYAALTAIVPVYVYWIARELGAPGRAARTAAWLVALSPAFVFFSGSLHKEGLILLVLAVAAYHTLRLRTRWRPRSLVAVTVSLLVLFGLRHYIAIVVGGAVLLALASGRGTGGLRATPVTMAVLMRQGVIVLTFITAMATVGFQENAERRLEESPEGVLVQMERHRENLALTAQSGYLVDADVSTPADAAEFFPIGLLYFLAAPFPWQTGSLRQNLVIPETLFWILLYPLVVAGAVRGFRVNRAGTVLLVAATGGMCIVYALVSGNIGIAYRMRTQVWLLWAPLAAWGWEVWREKRQMARRVRPRPLRRLRGSPLRAP
jgi:hypothetical protein